MWVPILGFPKMYFLGALIESAGPEMVLFISSKARTGLIIVFLKPASTVFKLLFNE